MRRFLLGAVAGVAVAGVVLLAILYFGDLRIESKPPSTTSSGTVPVPALVGQDITSASSRLTDVGLTPEIEEAAPWDNGPSGVVLQQSPPSGAAIPPGDPVTLILGTE